MATPSTCPQRSVRFPPTSRTMAPNSGNASSSHAARCTPTAGNVVSTRAAAAATCATASEPVTALLLVLQQAVIGSRACYVSRSELVLQQVRVVHRRGPAGTEDRHQDREAHHDLGSRHDHHEERDDLAVQVAMHPREGHEREVDRVEHELDAHEDNHRVAPYQHAHGADHEQDDGERDEVPGAHQASPSWLASPPASARTAALLPSSVRR